MSPDYLYALIGGVFIGCAATLLYWSHGRIFGISGIVQSLIDPKVQDKSWRLTVVVGMLIAGALYLSFDPALPTAVHASASASSSGSNSHAILLMAAGLLVGFGTQLGNGCTSGHGVCGISRLSPRSIIATLVFIACGMLTVFAVPYLKG